MYFWYHISAYLNVNFKKFSGGGPLNLYLWESAQPPALSHTLPGAMPPALGKKSAPCPQMLPACLLIIHSVYMAQIIKHKK